MKNLFGELGYYSDGVPFVKNKTLDGNLIVHRYSGFSDFMAMLFYVDSIYYLENREPYSLELFLPYLPGARQDKVRYSDIVYEGADRLFTARSIANEINIRKFKRVSVLDPHSNVMPALIDRCDCYDLDELKAILIRSGQFIGSYDGFIAPDVGSSKRVNKLAFGHKIIQCLKNRSISSGEIIEIEVPEMERGNYLVVDDICDGGRTFIELANVIKNKYENIKLDLFVTHGIFSKGTSSLKELYDNIYTTDSICIKREEHFLNDVKVLNIVANLSHSKRED